MEQIERFVVLLYQRASALDQVNEARLNLFTQNRKMYNILSTFHALDQHLKMAVYQAGLFGASVLFLALIFHHKICEVGTRQLMTIDHAGLPFQRQPEIAKNCWNMGVKRHVLRDAGVWKQTYYAQPYSTVRNNVSEIRWSNLHHVICNLYMVVCVDIIWSVAQKWWWYSYLVIHNNGAGTIHRSVCSHSQQWWWVLFFTNSQ